ncbi:hypothetical protein GCM10010442_24600 [Kitasatospora kifunensis]
MYVLIAAEQRLLGSRMHPGTTCQPQFQGLGPVGVRQRLHRDSVLGVCRERGIRAGQSRHQRQWQETRTQHPRTEQPPTLAASWAAAAPRRDRSRPPDSTGLATGGYSDTHA